MGFFFLAVPSFAVMFIARYLAARALGMKGIRLFGGGSIENLDRATPLRRAGVVVASLAASYLVASALFIPANLLVGDRVTGTDVDVIPGSPAAAAGLQSGDRITTIAGKRVSEWSELSPEIGRHVGEPVEIVVERSGEERRFTVTPDGAHGKARIGVAARPRSEPMGAGKAIFRGLVRPAQVTAAVARNIYALAAGSPEGELAGPAAIVSETGRAARTGPGELLGFIAAMLAYVWPITAVASIALVPRPARPARDKRA